MKKKSLIFSVILVVFFVSVMFTMLHSSIEYKIMAKTETLKGQIAEEHKIYTEQLFESVQVQRPWYSINPADWTFIVTLSSDSEIRHYRYVDGTFILNQE